MINFSYVLDTQLTAPNPMSCVVQTLMSTTRLPRDKDITRGDIPQAARKGEISTSTRLKKGVIYVLRTLFIPINNKEYAYVVHVMQDKGFFLVECAERVIGGNYWGASAIKLGPIAQLPEPKDFSRPLASTLPPVASGQPGANEVGGGTGDNYGLAPMNDESYTLSPVSGDPYNLVPRYPVPPAMAANADPQYLLVTETHYGKVFNV